MSQLDFERTQIWAKNLVNMPLLAAPQMATQAAVSPALPKKPIMKTMTREEKIILATGGALAIGLGAIVITSLSDDQIATTPPVVSNTDLTAPTLDLGVPAELVADVKVADINEDLQPIPKPHHTAPRHYTEKKETLPIEQPVPPEEHHALLQIPEIPEVATTAGDNLTFIEAFNTARAEVGPAGLFAWRDTYYSTFTDREWESVPEDQKQKWLDAAEPIIDPGYENLSESIPQNTDNQQYVVIAERGAITWTGIDKNGDGQTEVLMARINGQSPMVLMDTDDDGILDKRYDYEAQSGKTYSSDIQPFAMSLDDVEHLEHIAVDQDMQFYNHSGNEESTGSLPVSIFEENGQYVVSLDSNMDHTIDAITYLTDERGPVVGLDNDNDGKIEMGYIYHTESQTVSAIEMEPMEEMTLVEPTDTAIFYADENAEMNPYEMQEDIKPAINDEDTDDDLNDHMDEDYDSSQDENA